MATIDFLPTEIIQPILLLTLRISLPTTPSQRWDWGSRTRISLRLVCRHWNSIIGTGTTYPLRTASAAVALAAALRGSPGRRSGVNTLALVATTRRFYFDILDQVLLSEKHLVSFTKEKTRP